MYSFLSLNFYKVKFKVFAVSQKLQNWVWTVLKRRACFFRQVLKSIQDTQIHADREETVSIRKPNLFLSVPLSGILSMFLTQKANCQYYLPLAFLNHAVLLRVVFCMYYSDLQTKKASFHYLLISEPMYSMQCGLKIFAIY